MRYGLLVAAFLLGYATVGGAATLPVGTYTLTAGPGTGIHLSDPGSLTGTLVFNAASMLTSANLTFHDTLTGETDVFDTPGPTTTYFDGTTFVTSTIGDSANPAVSYDFTIRTPGLADGSFTLNCGVDCDTFISNTATNFYEEVQGSITPAATPEPSSLLLMGTGTLVLAGAARLGIKRRATRH